MKIIFQITLLVLSLNTHGALLETSESNTYYCMEAEGTSDHYQTLYPAHYFYAPFYLPRPIYEHDDYTGYCHNKFTYGEIDHILFPRLGNQSVSFLVFSQLDANFYDQDGNGTMDAEDSVIDAYKAATNKEIEWRPLFNALSSKSSPMDSSTRLGFIMFPIVDGNKVSCPSKSLSTNDLNYHVSRTFTGTAQLLYVARNLVRHDYLFFGANELKGVWFYYKKGKPTLVKSDNDKAQKTFFYYPIDKKDPLNKKTDQSLYRIAGWDEDYLRLDYQVNTPDKSLGCIPQ